MPLNEEWRKLATKQLKGADPEEKLTWHTAEVGSATCGKTAKQRQYHCLVLRVCLQFQHGIEEKVLITRLILENTFLKRGQSHCYHICDIRCNCICAFLLQKLLQLLVSSRLDYCNSSFRSIALVDITTLQHVQNYLARVYVNLCVNKIQNEDNIIVVILTTVQLSWPVVGQSPRSAAFRSSYLCCPQPDVVLRHSNHMAARAHLTTSSITNYYKKLLSTSFNYN